MEVRALKWYWMLLMTAAIVCALFSEKIDEFVKGNNELKKVIVIFGAGVLLVSAIVLIACIF